MTTPSPSADLFVVGDIILDITMPARDGRPVYLFHQELSGATLVLWRTGGKVSADAVADAERLAPQIADAQGHLVHLVVGAMPQDVPPLGPDSKLVQIFDPKNQIARLFGLERDGLILIDRNRRFAGLRSGMGPADAIAICRRNLEGAPDTAITGQAPVLLIPEIFSKAEAKSFVSYWETNDKLLVNNVARGDGGDNAYDNPQIKRRSDVPIQDRRLFELLKSRIESRVFPEILKAFQCTLTRMELPRIGCYDSAELGEFRRHRDNTTPFTAHRKFALSINLNDAFEGGAVSFPEYGRWTYRPATGGGVVFSCSLLHEAQPVTAGRRFGMFTFFTDDEGGKREDEMAAKYGNSQNRFALR